MGKLRNPKHESFCRVIVFEGKHPREAYVIAEYEPNRANHNKLLNRPDIKARLTELERERDLVESARRMPIAEMLAELANHGIQRVADFFESKSEEILAVRDLSTVRAEAILSLLNVLCDGTGLSLNGSGLPQRGGLQPPSGRDRQDGS